MNEIQNALDSDLLTENELIFKNINSIETLNNTKLIKFTMNVTKHPNNNYYCECTKIGCGMTIRIVWSNIQEWHTLTKSLIYNYLGVYLIQQSIIFYFFLEQIFKFWAQHSQVVDFKEFGNTNRYRPDHMKGLTISQLCVLKFYYKCFRQEIQDVHWL